MENSPVLTQDNSLDARYAVDSTAFKAVRSRALALIGAGCFSSFFASQKLVAVAVFAYFSTSAGLRSPRYWEIQRDMPRKQAIR